MSGHRAAAPWAVCFGRTRPASSVVSWSLPGATYCKLVVVGSLWSDVCCCNAAGQQPGLGGTVVRPHGSGSTSQVQQ